MDSRYYHIPMERPVTQFMYKVYGWMFVGLALTAVTSYSLFALFPYLLYQIICTPLIWVLCIAQIGLVLFLSWRISQLKYSMAALMFILYSILSGLTITPIFLVYTLSSIYATFFITSAMFGIMALYGYFTKSDLTTMGNIALMALMGIILAAIINMFLGSSHLDFAIAVCGVIIFTLLTAYDVQKIKVLSYTIHDSSANKIALVGALVLYLDFVNLFLNLLRLMGKRRD